LSKADVACRLADGRGSASVRAKSQFRRLTPAAMVAPGRGAKWMKCVACGGAGISERPERTAHGYLRFRYRECGKQFNERTGGSLNRTQYPSDVIALVVFWRLRYKLSLRDLPEMFLLRGIEFTYEAVRDWEAKLTPSLIDSLRRRRGGGSRVRLSWYVDETYIKVNGRWCYLYRAIDRTGALVDVMLSETRDMAAQRSSFDLPERSLASRRHG
jgi:putative transposase